MEEFKKELKELILKHKVTISEGEHYDNDGSFCGSTIYFSKNRESFDLSELIKYY